MVAGAGALRFAFRPTGPESAPELAAELTRQQTEVRRLDQDNAQLAAETQRLRQTLAELKANPVASVAPDGQPRRIPFRRADAEPPAHLLEAARWAGATIEVNARAADWLQSLVAGGAGNTPLLLSAAAGLAQPDPVVAAAGKVDYSTRTRLLDVLIQAVDDATATAQLAKLREALLARWAEAGGAATETTPAQ